MAELFLSCGCKSKNDGSEKFAFWETDQKDFDGLPIRAYGNLCREHYREYRTSEPDPFLSDAEIDYLLGDLEPDLGKEHKIQRAPNKKTNMNNVIAGALLDFLAFLAVGGEDEEFNSKMFERDFPTIEDLYKFAEARGLTMDSPRVSDWIGALNDNA